MPASFKASAEEDEFFEKEKAAGAVEEEVTEEEAAEEETTEEAPAEEVAEEQPAEEEAAEEAEEAPEGDAEEGEPKGQQVPIGELYKERNKRKELQSKIEQLEGTFARVMERLNAGVPGAQPGQQPAPAPQVEIPGYDVDPVAHLKARLDQLQGFTQQHQQQLQQQNAMQQFSTALAGLENQMRSQTADYDAAVEFAKRARLAELSALGYDAGQAQEMLRQEIVGTSHYLMQRGQNPAEAFYNYAKTRGWQQPQPAAPKPAVNPAKKLATVAKAQAAAKSLPRGGVAPKPSVTLADLAEMDDSEFDKNFEKVMKRGG